MASWRQSELDDLEFTRRIIEARDEAMRAEAAARQARWDAEAQLRVVSPDDAPDATQAAANLEAAVADLPAASKAKAKRVAKRMSKADRKAIEEADALKALIDKKNREQATKPPGPPPAAILTIVTAS